MAFPHARDHELVPTFSQIVELMNRLRRAQFCAFAACLCVGAAIPLSAQEPAQQSRRALFDGKDLNGWQQVGPGSFVVRDGMMKTEGGMGMLWYTREKIAHATIRVVFKLTAKESDSGVFIRIPEKPAEPWMPINRGYEVEIGDWPDDYSCTGVSTHLRRLWRVRSSGSANGTQWT